MAYPVQPLADGRTRLSDGTLQTPSLDDNSGFFNDTFNPSGSLLQGVQNPQSQGPVAQSNSSNSSIAPVVSSLFTPSVAISSQIGTQKGKSSNNTTPSGDSLIQHYLNDPRQPIEGKQAIGKAIQGGTDTKSISDALSSGGYKGYDPTTMNPDYHSATQNTPTQGDMASDIGNSLSQAPQAISDWIDKGVNQPQDWGQNAGNFVGGITTEAPKALGNLMGTPLELAGGIMKYGTQGTPFADIGNRASQGADTLASIPQAGGQAISDWESKNLKEGTGYNPESYSAGAGKLTDEGATMLAGLKGGGQAVGDLKVGSIVPSSVAENLSTKANRFSAGDIRKFTDMTGETPGQFAVSRGMTEVGPNAVEQSAQHFADSMNEADKAFDAIDGNFRYTGKGKDMIQLGMDDLQAKLGREANETDLPRLQELMSKYDSQGLTMSETNEFKRMFQNNNKFSYEQANSTEANRATNILDGIRNWQFKTADENGLSNIADINKTTQGWKAYSDMLDKSLTGKSGNNNVSLTDWILLSGGEPHNFAAVMAKKFAQSDYAKKSAIKMFANPSKEPIIKADLESIKNANKSKGYGNDNSIPNSGGSAGNPSMVNAPPIPKGLQPKPKPSPLSTPEAEQWTPTATKGFNTASPAESAGPITTAKNEAPVPDAIKASQRANPLSSVGGGGGEGGKIGSNLTTTILQKLEGRESVSKEFIENLAKNPEIKKQERDIIQSTLSTFGSKIDVGDFTKAVVDQLLPIKIKTTSIKEAKYEDISLPKGMRGDVADYSENVYESPIKNSAGDIHFRGQTEGYFGHTRVEDMADKETRRIIEVQSDLYQRGRIDSMLSTDTTPISEESNKILQYDNPSAHFRMVREEIAAAIKDGKEKLQFPTGETAMKIEGLGDIGDWTFTGKDFNTSDNRLRPDNIKIGQDIEDRADKNWVITEVLGDGKFKAVKKDVFYKELEALFRDVKEPKSRKEKFEYTAKNGDFGASSETFDVSERVDTSNPIYKFYEKELGKYLKNKFDAKTITDDKGVTWNEVDLSKIKPGAVTAFSHLGTLGVAGLGLGSILSGEKKKKI